MCESCESKLPKEYKKKPSRFDYEANQAALKAKQWWREKPEPSNLREQDGGNDFAKFSKFTGRRFSLGQLVMTASVASDVADNVAFSAFMYASLKRHANCDWGEMDPEDIQENNNALTEGNRLFSAYKLPDPLKHALNKEKIWIITESDRSVTTILWPEDY
jgi:hypothetical protein